MEFSAYLVSFAKNAKPDARGLPAWSTFDPDTFELMHFRLDGGPKFELDPRQRGLALIEQAASVQPVSNSHPAAICSIP
jgi:carboxylesterase type B